MGLGPVSGAGLSARQGCDGGCARARINTVPGSSLLQAAPPRPLHFQKDGKEHFPVEMVTTDGSHVTQAMVERATFSLEKKLKGDRRATFQYLRGFPIPKGCHKGERFQQVPCGSTG